LNEFGGLDPLRLGYTIDGQLRAIEVRYQIEPYEFGHKTVPFGAGDRTEFGRAIRRTRLYFGLGFCHFFDTDFARGTRAGSFNFMGYFRLAGRNRFLRSD